MERAAWTASSNERDKHCLIPQETFAKAKDGADVWWKGIFDSDTTRSGHRRIRILQVPPT